VIAFCGNQGYALCGCEYHRAYTLLNPHDPGVQEERARTLAWMAEHPACNPATGRPMGHPDDYLVQVYGAGLTETEAGALGLLIG